MVCNLRKKSEDQILDRIIENLPKDNDKYYIEHDEYLNMFMITLDLNQWKKDDLFNLILNLDKKLVLAREAKNDRNVKELIRLRKRAVNFFERTRRRICHIRSMNEKNL